MKKRSFGFRISIFCFLFLSFSFAHSVSFNLSEVRSNYIVAMRMLQEGRSGMAEDRLKQILRVPGIRKGKGAKYYLKASFYLGRIYFNRQDWTRSEEFFRRVVAFGEKKDAFPSALYYLARTRFAQGSFTDGISFMNAYRAKYRNKEKLEPDSLYWSAFAYAELKDWTLADLLLSDLSRRYPYSQANRMGIDLRIRVSDQMKARKELEKAYVYQTNLIVLQSNQILTLSNRLERMEQRERLLQIILRMQNALRNLSELKASQLDRLNRLKNSGGNP